MAMLFLLGPLVVVVIFSFNSTGSLAFPMRGLSLRWYEEVFSTPEFREAVLTSLYLAALTAAITAVLGTLAAYGTVRAGPRLRTWATTLFFLPLVLPVLFIGVALLVTFSRLDVPLSLGTIVVGHTLIAFPFFFVIARVALERSDPMLEEAAADLGASPLRCFVKVTLPQVGPLLAAATALAFMVSLDEFVVTFFVSGNETTLPLFIFSRLRTTLDPAINVVSTLLMAVTLTLFLAAALVSLRTERRRRRRSLSPTLEETA
jgi:ABC-type spermidine/putrescine transport system permease subunit II